MNARNCARRVVENFYEKSPINRCGLLPAMVKHNRDGSLDVYRQARSPDLDRESGCLMPFNGRLCGECSNANWFTSLCDARRKIETWRQGYNEQRPPHLHYVRAHSAGGKQCRLNELHAHAPFFARGHQHPTSKPRPLSTMMGSGSPSSRKITGFGQVSERLGRKALSRELGFTKKPEVRGIG